MECQSEFLGQPCESFAKERDAIAVAPTAISEQQNRVAFAITPFAQPMSPTMNRCCGQFARVGAFGQHHEYFLLGQAVHVVEGITLTVGKLVKS